MTEMGDLILVSVDDHVIEPPDLFVNHLDAKYRDRAPKLRAQRRGSDVWKFGDLVMETAALNAVAGPPEGGVRHGAAEPRRGSSGLLRRPRARQGHGRGRGARLDELPVVPHIHGAHLRQ